MILRSLLIVSPDSDRPLDQAAASGADALIVDVAKAGAEALRRTAGFLGAAAPGAVFVRWDRLPPSTPWRCWTPSSRRGPPASR